MVQQLFHKKLAVLVKHGFQQILFNTINGGGGSGWRCLSSVMTSQSPLYRLCIFHPVVGKCHFSRWLTVSYSRLPRKKCSSFLTYQIFEKTCRMVLSVASMVRLCLWTTCKLLAPFLDLSLSASQSFVSAIYLPRTQMTHILEDYTHKMEGQPPKKGCQMASR